MFHIGQKVICVCGWSNPGRFVIDFPETGKIYHVDRCIEGYIVLVEIKRIQKGAEIVWDAKGFRPLEERKTDISIFTAMLNPSDRRVKA